MFTYVSVKADGQRSYVYAVGTSYTYRPLKGLDSECLVGPVYRYKCRIFLLDGSVNYFARVSSSAH